MPGFVSISIYIFNPLNLTIMKTEEKINAAIFATICKAYELDPSAKMTINTLKALDPDTAPRGVILTPEDFKGITGVNVSWEDSDVNKDIVYTFKCENQSTGAALELLPRVLSGRLKAVPTKHKTINPASCVPVTPAYKAHEFKYKKSVHRIKYFRRDGLKFAKCEGFYMPTAAEPLQVTDAAGAILYQHAEVIEYFSKLMNARATW